VRDVLYATVGRERREILHGRIGEALAGAPSTQPGQLDAVAYHFSRSPRHIERAIDTLGRAGRDAARLYANGEAVQHFQRALALLARLPAGAARNARMCAVGIALADVEALRGEPEAALAAARAAMTVAQEPEERAALFRRIGALAAGLGEDDAWAHFTAAATLLEDGIHGAEWARLRVAMARTLIDRGDLVPALPLLADALALLQADDPLGQELGDLAEAYNALGGALISHDAPPEATSRALACWQQALRLWETIGNEDGVARAHHNLGLGHRARGEWDQALTRLREAELISQRTGNRRLQALAAVNQGECLMTMGRWRDALVVSTQGAAGAERAGQLTGVAFACANAGWICLACGDLREADRWLARSLALADQLGTVTHRWFTLRGLGQVAVARGLLADAHTHHQDALAVGLEEHRCRIASLIDLAQLARLRRDLVQARSLLQEANAALADETNDWAILLLAASALEEGLTHAEEHNWMTVESMLAQAMILAERVASEPAEALSLRIHALIALGLSWLERPSEGGQQDPAMLSEARRHLEDAYRLSRQSGRLDCLLRAQLALAEAYLRGGERESARQLIGSAGTSAEAGGYAPLQAWATILAAHDAHAEGQPEAAALKSQALAAIRALDLPALQAQADMRLGSHARATRAARV
jgi:tetratricopeptide (TPR) repeat protein